jgi:hypothetical protein
MLCFKTRLRRHWRAEGAQPPGWLPRQWERCAVGSVCAYCAAMLRLNRRPSTGDDPKSLEISLWLKNLVVQVIHVTNPSKSSTRGRSLTAGSSAHPHSSFTIGLLSTPYVTGVRTRPLIWGGDSASTLVCHPAPFDPSTLADFGFRRRRQAEVMPVTMVAAAATRLTVKPAIASVCRTSNARGGLVAVIPAVTSP